nr:condensation domain-containing protein [Enterovibrio nigricans]
MSGSALLSKTSSYRQWSEKVADYSQLVGNESKYWQASIGNNANWPEPSKQHYHTVSLAEGETDLLLHEANLGYGTEINDLLVSALSVALCEVFDQSEIGITMEGHGRELCFEGIDVSRTVGWFTVQYPLLLSTGDTLGETIVKTRETLNQVPNKGVGFGTFAAQNGQKIKDLLPPVVFNYFGQFDNAKDHDSGLWEITGEPCGETVAKDNQSHLILDINGAVLDGKLSFTVGSRLSEPKSEAFVNAFQDALCSVVKHCCEVEHKAGFMSANASIDIVTGDVPVVPVMHWLFRRGEEFSHHNGYHWLRVNSGDIPFSAVEKAYTALVTQHDIARSRVHNASGEWRHQLVGVSEFLSLSPAEYVDFRGGVNEGELVKYVQDKLASIDLSIAPMKLCYIELPNHEARVLFFYHHMIFDGYSRSILQNDFIYFLNEAVLGRKIVGIPKTDSVKMFSEQLKKFANTEAAESSDYWLNLPWNKYAPMPKDNPQGDNTIVSARMVETTLSEECSEILLGKLAFKLGVPENIIHLACFAKAYGEWTGNKAVVIDIAKTTRTLPYLNVDLSRTVGWMIDPVPIILDLENLSGNIIDAIHEVDAHINGMPHQGVSYGCLRYLSSDEELREKMSHFPHAEILFNYQASLTKQVTEDVQLPEVAALIEEAPENIRPEEGGSSGANIYESPTLQRGVCLYIEGVTTEDGCFKSRFQYSQNIHNEEAIQTFSDLYVNNLIVLTSQIAFKG